MRYSYARQFLHLPLALPLVLGGVGVAHAQFSNSISIHLCPYDCSSLGLSKNDCSDWRKGPLCYVEDLRRKSSKLPGYKFCIRTGNGSIKVLLVPREQRDQLAPKVPQELLQHCPVLQGGLILDLSVSSQRFQLLARSKTRLTAAIRLAAAFVNIKILLTPVPIALRSDSVSRMTRGFIREV